MGFRARLLIYSFLFLACVCSPTVANAQGRRLPDRLRTVGVPRSFSLGPVAESDRPLQRRPAKLVGMRRPVPATALSQPGFGVSGDGRNVLSASVSSPGASRMRVHFRDFDAGTGEVWIYDSGGQAAAGPYTGKGIFGTGEFWSASVESDSVVVSYVAPAGGSPTAFPFAVDAVTHQFAEATPTAGPNSAAASCNIDVTCRPEYAELAKAVVQFDFIAEPESPASQPGMYVCSGAMVSTRAGSGRPYMATANHCIANEYEANSIEARFFYQTQTCNGDEPDWLKVPTVLGGSYLAGGDIAQGDYSLVLLRSVPAGVTFLKWSSTLDTAAHVSGIHHPDGDYKRLSIGTRVADRTLVMSGGLIGPKDSYYNVNWSEGVTEGGSSGSPLIDRDGNMVGTLTGGPALTGTQTACTVEPRSAVYGRFSAAYGAYSPYLEDAPTLFSVSKTSLSFQVRDGVAAPEEELVALSTQGASPLVITASSNRPWITVTGGGTLLPGAQSTIAVRVNGAALNTAGDFNGLVTISAGASSVSLLVTASVRSSRSSVNITVSPSPVYQVSSALGRWNYGVTINETAGTTVQLNKFQINDRAWTGAELGELFGTTTLAGPGSLAVNFYSTTLTPPTTRVFRAEGVDVETGRTWEAERSVKFAGPLATLSVTNAPSTVYRNPQSAAACQWSQKIIVRETAGAGAQLTGFSVGATDLSGELARDFGTVRLPANGSLSATLCWRTQTESQQTVEIRGIDDYGTAISASSTVRFSGQYNDPASLSVSPQQLELNSSGVGEFTLNVGSAPWITAIVSEYDAKWLTVSPPLGVGSGKITVTTNAAGLENGYYSASILVYAQYANPQFVPLTVGMRVGAAGAKPVIYAGGLTNAWATELGISPGSLISIWGENLAAGTEAAPAVPFSNRMAGTSVTINGIQAPLSYVSPTQLNVQVPFETQPGSAEVTVTVNGQSDQRSMAVSALAPAICTDFTAAANLCYEPAGKRGDYRMIFITGHGSLSPTVPTGGAPFIDDRGTNYPHASQPVTVKIGGKDALVDFAGIPFWSVGVMQINVQIPEDADLGRQPVVVSVGGVPSQTAYITVLPKVTP